jgi:hypothetical protein
MRKIRLPVLSFILITSLAFGQTSKTKEGHTNQNKFKQLKELLPTPNSQRTASGAPGLKYTQQKVDYKIDILLDDENTRIYGNETITYHNNSDDTLAYLWVQLDQNMRAADSKSPDIESNSIPNSTSKKRFDKSYMSPPFDGGFNIESVLNINNAAVSYTINQTMMRINLSQPLASGEKFKFKIKWWYNINNHRTDGGRSGYEHFAEDDNNNYVIAQFYPRLCVYDNVEGWQNDQFWGRSEFALEFGDFTVNITTPADHMLGATGVLLNEEEVLTKIELKRLKIAKITFENPVLIRTQEEAEKNEKEKSTKTKTWKFYAENVRDYAFASSRKFIWDAMAVGINGKTVMAYSLYSKEANPLYGDHSTRAVAQTLKTYSEYTFDYPYHKAISVDGQMGMEYPQICFNPGRPDANGTYSDRVKYRMIKVTIHEVGHNFFPMIVNSDERQWTWMDEGLNSYMEMLAELAYDKDFPITRGYPKNIVGYMSGDQSKIAPIMSKGDHVYEFGNNAYGKPATALWILRETIMGKELFDHAFKTYSKRWMFKHPTPADFFRTMEDASGIDLDWFWRGWFYSTEVTDIGIEKVRKFYAKEDTANKTINFIEDSSEGLNISKPETVSSKYFYEITFNKPGGLVMPIIVEYTYDDGSTERKTYPAQIWRLNDQQVTKAIDSEKQLTKIVIDPDFETADVDPTNNSFPNNEKDAFSSFKNKMKN